MMKQYVVLFAITIGLLALAGCGHPATEMVFSTSTGGYAVSTDGDAAAMASLGGSDSGISVTSVIRIPMEGIADSKMQAVWLQALVLQASAGDLRFVQLAKCYVQRRAGSSTPVLVGTARASDVAEDGRSIKFQVDSGQELSGTVRSAFTIVIEIEGNSPTGKVNVSADLKLKARITI
ncbi:MAG: hypothetical protein HY075_03635 [Deltaproteobacteria bacterium]|nr:hypothetical protein [Deltaproteobacteria bacterium]